MKEFFAIGDSHSLFFEQSGFMKSHWLGPIHTATIYQLLKLGLDMFNLQQLLAKSNHYVNIGVPQWQSKTGTYNTNNIKTDDRVIFCFGFNDVQKNIYEHAKDNPEIEIDRLLNEYILLLKEYELRYKIRCIPCSISPNPSLKIEEATGNFTYGINGDFSTSGTSEERNHYTIYANSVLKRLCAQHDLMFLNIYDDISDTDGFLRKEYTRDYVHLDHTNLDVVEIIKNKIQLICA